MIPIALTADQQSALDVARIYILKEPRDGSVRYVGKTMRPLKRRLVEHVAASTKEGSSQFDTYRSRWIRGLLAADLYPVIEEIEIIVDCWAERERFWISHYKDYGARLTNLTDGGEGTFGRRATEEQRQRCRVAAKARMANPDTRQKVRDAAIAQAAKPGARERMAEAGRNRTASSREQISQSVKTITTTPEGRARMKAQAAAQWADPAMRDQLTASRRRTHRTPEARERARARALEQWSKPGARELLCAALKKKPRQSAESRARAAASNCGRKRSPEACVRISSGKLKGSASRRFKRAFSAATRPSESLVLVGA